MNRENRVEKLLQAIPDLSDFGLKLIGDIVTVFQQPKDFSRHANSTIVTDRVLDDFGDVLRMHHCLSREPFSKDKFEYALEKVLNGAGIEPELAPRGQPGFDIRILSDQFSLKTEAAKNIKVDTIYISKFMELGGGEWSSNPEDLEGLRGQFLQNLTTIDRILVLRASEKEGPKYRYELVEIPKALLKKAEFGRLEMKLKSKQDPKPGYCRVEEDGELQFSLYFDGGGERKLQIKSLRKSLCTVRASWKFEITKDTP